MRRLGVPAAVIALLVAGGFAAVSIAQGGGLAHITTTGTTGLTVTTPVKKVTLCHRTHSKKKPFVTITVAVPAVQAHLRHGDVLGRCTVATITKMKRRGNKHTTTTTTTTTTTSATQTTSPTHGKSGEHGKSGKNGNGNSGNHGGGHH
jgi:hypothetical protein